MSALPTNDARQFANQSFSRYVVESIRGHLVDEDVSTSDPNILKALF
jgi:hypothetical protein